MPSQSAETLPKKHSSEVKRVLDSLPVQDRQIKPLLDQISSDHWEEDSTLTRVFFTAITWVTAISIVTAVAYLTWVMFTEI